MPHTDADAVALARGGDSEAFRALVERHSRAVYRLAHRMTGSPHDAEDVVQETFLKAYRQLGRFEARADFRTWIHRIAVNCAIDHIRARRHRESGRDPADLDSGVLGEVALSTTPLPDRQLLSSEIGDRVADTMARLTPLERAAFTLRHLEGRTLDEICTALGLKQEAAKHSVFRAVKKMRAALEPLLDVHRARSATRVAGQ